MVTIKYGSEVHLLQYLSSDASENTMRVGLHSSGHSFHFHITLSVALARYCALVLIRYVRVVSQSRGKSLAVGALLPPILTRSPNSKGRHFFCSLRI